MYARKQYSHDARELTSLSQGFIVPGKAGRVVAILTLSNSLSNDILSSSRSLVSTYAPEHTLPASFCGTGSKTGDKHTPELAGLGEAGDW